MSRPDSRTPDPRPAAEGWKPLRVDGHPVPGVYEDQDGAIHFAVPELLDFFGWADNAHNRDLVEQEVRRVCGEIFPAASVEVRE